LSDLQIDFLRVWQKDKREALQTPFGQRNRVIEGLEEQNKKPEESGSNLPDSAISPQILHVGRRAATLTEQLCGLYIMATMNMDFSLIRYLIQSGQLKSWVKECVSEPQACVNDSEI
jgi:hypothetical protein